MKKFGLGTIFGSVITCLILSLVFYLLSMPKKEKLKFVPAPEGFAVMIYDEEKQDYVESENLPIGGYKLNSEKSYCTNGGTIDSYDSKNGKVNYSVEGTDECVIYLDIAYTVNVSSSNTSYGTVSPGSQIVKPGSSVSITINPLSGYSYSSNTCGGTVSGNILTITNIQSDLTCSVNFEKIYYYAYGLPTTSSTTDYTTLNRTVLVRDDTPEETTREVCIIRNNELHCFKNNNWETERYHVQEVFSDITCNRYGSIEVICVGNDFDCYVDSSGVVDCGDFSTKDSCAVNSNGSVECYIDQPMHSGGSDD